MAAMVIKVMQISPADIGPTPAPLAQAVLIAIILIAAGLGVYCLSKKRR